MECSVHISDTAETFSHDSSCFPYDEANKGNRRAYEEIYLTEKLEAQEEIISRFMGVLGIVIELAQNSGGKHPLPHRPPLSSATEI